jgi:hypothetical protein
VTGAYKTLQRSTCLHGLCRWYCCTAHGCTAALDSSSGEQPELGISAAIEGLRQFLAWDTFARRKIDFVDRKVGGARGREGGACLHDLL